jgi:uncharacterized protein (DUF433 family)
MAQLELPESEPLPLKWVPDGAVRIGKTRVSLDSVIYHFNNGSTPEEIKDKFQTLDLADIYGTISYYLRHREEVDAFLAERRLEAEEIRREIEKLCPPDDFRERLLARRAQVK